MAKITYEFFDYRIPSAVGSNSLPRTFELLQPIPVPTKGKIISVKLTLTIKEIQTAYTTPPKPEQLQSSVLREPLVTARISGNDEYPVAVSDRIIKNTGDLLSVSDKVGFELLDYIPIHDVSKAKMIISGGSCEDYFQPSGSSGVFYYYPYFSYYDNSALPGAQRSTTLIVTIADIPDRPTPISPMSGDNIAPSTATTAHFSWIHNRSPETGLPQKGYELQVSSDNLNWTTFNDSTANQFADIPLSSLPVGRVFWRVRTIDTDDIPSDYSVSQFFNIGSPSSAPTIITSVFESSRPILEWSTDFAQKAYHVQINYGNINIVDIYAETAEQFYIVPVALENNTQYIVRVRAKDSSGVFSDWAEDAISADYAVPGTPSFLAVKKNNIVEITIDNSLDGDEVIRNDIYRLAGADWIRIGTTQSGEYYDWSAPNGTVEYKVSAVGTSGETFSEVVAVDYFQRYGVLLSVADPYQTHSVKYNFDDKHTNDTGPVLMEFAGRGVPVAEFDEFERRAISLTYTTKSYSEYTNLEAMLKSKSIMLYRDRRQKMYGVCTNVGATRENTTGTLYAVSFVLSETEYDEAISV